KCLVFGPIFLPLCFYFVEVIFAHCIFLMESANLRVLYESQNFKRCLVTDAKLLVFLRQNSSNPMSSSYEKYQKRRLISSYFSVVISISLVLFLLGLLGLLVLNSKKVADYFKEQIAITVFLKD